MRSSSNSNTQLATDRQIERAEARYKFYALQDGRRMRLDVDAICHSDAEASLVALSLTGTVVGVEVQRDGILIYDAPCRSWYEGLTPGHA